MSSPLKRRALIAALLLTLGAAANCGVAVWIARQQFNPPIAMNGAIRSYNHEEMVEAMPGYMRTELRRRYGALADDPRLRGLKLSFGSGPLVVEGWALNVRDG